MGTYGGGINKTHEFLNAQLTGVTLVNSPNNVIYEAPANTTVEIELTALRWVSGAIVQTLNNANQYFKIVPYDPTIANWNPDQAILRNYPLDFGINLASPGNLYQMLNEFFDSVLFDRVVAKGDKIILKLNPKDRLYFGWLPISNGTLAIIGEVTKYVSSF